MLSKIPFSMLIKSFNSLNALKNNCASINTKKMCSTKYKEKMCVFRADFDLKYH